MRVPVVQGLIERRVLVNFRVDPEVMQRHVPAPFRVVTVAGHAIAGICLIRLAQERPRFVPRWAGLRSENAAHRVAVTWDAAEGPREGVFVLRRDTSSVFNTWVGGRLFHGTHHRAHFSVAELGDRVDITMRSTDGITRVAVRGSVAPALPGGSVFADLGAASRFFEGGAVGWSPNVRAGCFDCLELRSRGWRVEPLAVEHVESSWLDDDANFPRSAVAFDSALLMRGIEHRWSRTRGCRARTVHCADAPVPPGSVDGAAHAEGHPRHGG